MFSRLKYYVARRSDFNGNVNDDGGVLLKFPHILYIGSNHGFFCFNGQNSQCKKILTKEQLQEKEELLAIINKLPNEESYGHLTEEGVETVERCTGSKAPVVLVEASVDLGRYLPLYKLALDFMKDASLPQDNEKILEVLKALAIPEEARNRIAVFIDDPNERERYLADHDGHNILNLFSTSFKDKSPSEMSGFFINFCRRSFIDPSLEDKFRAFSAILKAGLESKEDAAAKPQSQPKP